MERCPDCNGVMLKSETKCGFCGTKVESGHQGSGPARFVMVVNVALALSVAVTGAALFLPGLPAFSSLVPFTVVLLMVRGSAGQMIDTKR
jgi:uncharacterized protein (DUF983 family)